MLKRYIVSLCLCISVLMLQAQQEYSAFDKAFHSISSNEIMGYVEEMCKPVHKGRLAGSPEYTWCAQWVANYFSAWGLTPGGDNGFYLQNFPIQYTDVKDEGLLRVTGDDMDILYRVPEDYYPGTHTASGILKGEVVYAGFGITAPELGYDDYAGFDVKGKIVVIEPGVPCERNSKEYARWDDPYSGSVYKVENAVKHGAAGVLFTGKFSHPGILYHEGLIYCHIGDHVLNDLLKGTPWTARTLKEDIRKEGRPHSMKLAGKEVEMMFRAFHAKSQTQNIIGYIPGTDKRLKDSPIIVGAHLDHLGCPGLLFPGALDNASGSAIVMETARAFAASGVKPLRPVVFILFGAEEPGMLGSKFYVSHPLFPLDKTFCMFNLDMVGNGTELRVGGVNSFPELKKYFVDANNQYIRRILHTSDYQKASGRMYTDGEIFNFNGVPAFSLGTRNKVGRTYYHVPEDVPGTLTPEIMEDVSKLLYTVLCKLSCDPRLRLSK